MGWSPFDTSFASLSEPLRPLGDGKRRIQRLLFQYKANFVPLRDALPKVIVTLPLKKKCATVYPFLMKTFSIISLGILLALTSPSFALAAKLDLKPGLWEVSMKMKGDEATQLKTEMAKALAGLPAAQRKQAEAMMAAQGGADALMNRAVSTCYTKEGLEKPETLATDSEGDCQNKITEQTSKRIKVSFSCKDGTTGSGEWNLKSSTAYNGSMQMKRKTGGPLSINYAGKFLKADCGDVKPLTAKH